MSNPFKIKNLEEFTIVDCETYLASYPYGEHYSEVNKRLRDLKRGKIKLPEVVEKQEVKPSFGEMCNQKSEQKPKSRTDKEIQPESGNKRRKSKKRKRKPQDETIATFEDSYNQPSPSYSYSQTHVKPNVQSDSDDVVGNILYWIGIIIAAIVIGYIIICIYNAIIPDETAKFIDKYQYIIYVACLALVKWIDEKRKQW